MDDKLVKVIYNGCLYYGDFTDNGDHKVKLTRPDCDFEKTVNMSEVEVILTNRAFQCGEYERVFNNVVKYFEKELPAFQVIDVYKASAHPDDRYLNHVIAYDTKTKDYSCWTSWNESTQCLNFGHYNLPTIEAALKVLKKYFHNVDFN